MAAQESIYVRSTPQVIHIAEGNEVAAWESIQEATGGRLTGWGIQRLRSGLDGYVKSVFVEPLYVCKDYRNLFSHFYSKKFVERSSYCSRLHFLGREGLTVEDVVYRSEDHRDDYLGFSVLEPVTEHCLGRTVIDPFKVREDTEGLFCLRTKTRVHIQGADYEVNGFPYRSQSGEATVCAHTALWCACRYLSERYTAYRELYPYDLIEMTGDTNGRRVPYRGMTYTDYSTILSGFGCHPAIIRPKGTETTVGGKKSKDWSKDRDSYYDLYAYMESGFPVLASFGGHVVNIIGHTLSDTMMAKHVPEQGFYNSAAMLKDYVVVDDNFFPYQRLGYDGVQQYYPPAAYASTAHPPTIDSIFAAVVPLPEKAYLRPADARRCAYKFLNHESIRRLVEETVKELACSPDSLVARQLLTSSMSFKRRKREDFRKQGDELLTYPICLNLPHFIWVMEVTAADLYKKRQCFGEVVLDATVGPDEWEPIYARIGRYLVMGSRRQRLDNAPVSYPQYSHNLAGIQK